MRAEHGREAPVLTGLRVGGVTSVCVAALAVVGLTPFFSWVPETPLVLTAVLIPILGYGLAGYRSASISRRALDGVTAGLVAGVVSGAVGGMSYVLFGKPVLNAFVGPILGAVGGSVVGGVAAVIALRRADPSR